MHTVELGVQNAKVLTLVGAAAFLARERGCRDPARERKGVTEEGAQAALGAV